MGLVAGRRGAAAVIVLLLFCAPAAGAGAGAGAAELSFSGFGTVGYAISDQPYGYQRFIDERGTFKRDTVAGLQLDAKFAGGFGATAQVKAAPATANDRRYEATVPWAFASYRPTNDWLIRAGRQRIPFYLFSENYDVGATYDFARLPTEMYSIAPSNDFTGLSIGKTWKAGSGEIALDGYWGESQNDFRFWIRDDSSAAQRPGAVFSALDFKGGGVLLSYKLENHVLRIGLHHASVKLRDGQTFPTSFPFVEIAPGVGYYQVDAALPGPGIVTVDHVTNTTVTVGADLALPAGFRVIGEYARSAVPISDLAPQGMRGYVSLLKHWGQWTPYVTYAFLHSPAWQRSYYDAVNRNVVPAFVPGAAQINASQRLGADRIAVFDQSSWALGTSYSFSATSKIKGEYLRTRIGLASTLIDAPPGGDVRHQVVNVFSLSYSAVF